MFSEVGYHGTNTAEIARRAGVSTGIVYGYFQDKRDIMICVLQLYMDSVYAPILAEITNSTAPFDFNTIVPQLLADTIAMHEKHEKLHNTLHSLATTDEAVNAKFIAMEDEITKSISEKLAESGLNIENVKEKVHLAMNIVQSFAHEYVFDKHPYIDYAAMRETVCKTIIYLFEG